MRVTRNDLRAILVSAVFIGVAWGVARPVSLAVAADDPVARFVPTLGTVIVSAGLCGLVVIVRTNNLLRGALLVLPALAVAGVVLWLGSLLAGAPRTGETITYQFSFSAMIAVAWLIGALAIELVDRCLKASGEELRE